MAHTDDTQMVVKAIQERIARIKSGYEVQSRELDGCDECGEKYWVECQNGFSGRSWDIDPAIEDDIKCFFKRIKEKGIKVISLTGKDGGKLSKLSDIEIRAPHLGYSDRIQEIHIKVIHILILLIEN